MIPVGKGASAGWAHPKPNRRVPSAKDRDYPYRVLVDGRQHVLDAAAEGTAVTLSAPILKAIACAFGTTFPAGSRPAGAVKRSPLSILSKRAIA